MQGTRGHSEVGSAHTAGSEEGMLSSAKNSAGRTMQSQEGTKDAELHLLQSSSQGPGYSRQVPVHTPPVYNWAWNGKQRSGKGVGSYEHF